jgi:hypothetical protein
MNLWTRNIANEQQGVLDDIAHKRKLKAVREAREAKARAKEKD